MESSSKRNLALAVVFLLGAAWAFTIRFVLVDNSLTHYHANFAIYTDGQRDPLSAFTLYEEVSACSADHDNEPKSRVHMHDKVPHVIHVHDKAVTWSSFFENIDYIVDDDVLKTDQGFFGPNVGGKQIRFILNGSPVSDLSGRVIGDRDILLIDYGDDPNELLLERYQAIPTDAAEYNVKGDPASCSGGKDEELGDRLKRTLGI